MQYNCYFYQDNNLLCRCRGNNFEGMPYVDIVTKDFSYALEAYDYLLYPVIEIVNLMKIIIFFAENSID